MLYMHVLIQDVGDDLNMAWTLFYLFNRLLEQLLAHQPGCSIKAHCKPEGWSKGAVSSTHILELAFS
jgi:hypothetical protein